MSELVLGIDLGTTNSVVAVADANRARVVRDVDGAELVPSVVSFQEGKAVAGELARERRLVDASNTVYAIKRLIGRPFNSPEVTRAKDRFAFEFVEGKTGGVEVMAGGEQWTLPEISAFVLRECRGRAERVLGQSCSKVVITVPANFNELQRSATKAAGTIAGLDVLRIINEPTAAAVAHGYTSSDAKRVAVYDLGGGTFDITILEYDGDVFEVVATAGDTFLGGDDFDRLIAEWLAAEFEDRSGTDLIGSGQPFERLRAAAEWAKCSLSVQSSVEISIAELMTGEDKEPIGFTATLTREWMNKLLMPLVEQSTSVCEDAMKIAGVTSKEIDQVVLVGGSTRVPLVQDHVGKVFGRAPRLEFDPDVVVALGAAIQASSLSDTATPKAVFSPPSPALVMAKKNALRQARAKRPKQPAFAPKKALAAIKLKKQAAEAANEGPASSAMKAVAAQEVGSAVHHREHAALGDATAKVAAEPATNEEKAPRKGRSKAKPAAAPKPRLPETPGWRPPAPPALRKPKLTLRKTDGKHDAQKAVPENEAAEMEAAEMEAAEMEAAEMEAAEMEAAVASASGTPGAGSLPGFEEPLPEERTPILESLPKPVPPGPPSIPVRAAEVKFLSKRPPPHVPPPPGKLPSLRPSAGKLGVVSAPRPPALPAKQKSGANKATPPRPPALPTKPSTPRQPPPMPMAGSDPDSLFPLGPTNPSTADNGGVVPIAPAPPPLRIQGVAQPTHNPVLDDPLPQPMVDPWEAKHAFSPEELFGSEGPETASAEDLFDDEDAIVTEDGPRQDVVLTSSRPVILMDVTPHSLGIETVGGYCEHIIDRNAPIPVEQTRMFTTAQDGQDTVCVTICQGESRVPENQELGILELTELLPRNRGEVKIEVTFMLDANGTLDVHATDVTTSKAQSTRINLVGGFEEGELDALQERQAKMMGA